MLMVAGDWDWVTKKNAAFLFTSPITITYQLVISVKKMNEPGAMESSKHACTQDYTFPNKIKIKYL